MTGRGVLESGSLKSEVRQGNKYMARIAGVDLPRTKRVEIGLTYIFGIGRVRSNRSSARPASAATSA